MGTGVEEIAALLDLVINGDVSVSATRAFVDVFANGDVKVAFADELRFIGGEGDTLGN